jgi:DNA repair exonuclease SbcCD ATPase subunit
VCDHADDLQTQFQVINRQQHEIQQLRHEIRVSKRKED